MRAWGPRGKRTRDGPTPGQREGLPRQDATRLYLALCQRITTELAVDERRRLLVLACTNAVVSAHDLSTLTTGAEWAGCVELVMGILQQTTQATLKISDPFARQKKSAENVSEDDTIKVLPNLQWELPDLYWTALILMAKLCNMEPILDEKYPWAWRGENDDFYRYRQKESAALTKAFFSGQQKVPFQRNGHTVDLSNMTDLRSHSGIMTWIHFQCIPSKYRYKNSFKNVGKQLTERLRKYSRFTELKKILQTSSFGSNEASQLCKMIYLHVVCHDTPSNSEDAKHAFRSLVAQQPLSVLEAFSTQLLSRDAMWAPILLESGIADALTELPMENHTSIARMRTRHGLIEGPRDAQRSLVQKHSREPHSATRSPPFKISPVAEAIRKTSNRVSLSQTSISDVALPCSMTSIIDFMQHASCRELISWLKICHPQSSTNLGVFDDTVYPLIEKWLSENPKERNKVGMMVATYTYQELQQLALEGVNRKLLEEVTEAKVITLPICASTRQNSCSNGHTMYIHFSTNWLCNQCGKTTAYGALSCRLCDYDLCYQCSEAFTGCVKANPTATVAELLSSWNRTLANVKHHLNDAEKPSLLLKEKSDAAKLLYTQISILSMSIPVSSLVRDKDGIHAGSSCTTCRCEIAVPNRYIQTPFQENNEAPSERSGISNNAYWKLLLLCREEVSQDPSVTHALIEAVESYATDIFLYGIEGLPHRLRMIMISLERSLPLSLKVEITRFLSVDCRRYALYHIQESHIMLSGTVKADVDSNGLPYKLTVSRGDLDNIVTKISEFFIKECPSLRNKLEIQFEREEGTGTGPTREFYSELSALYRNAKYLWYMQDEGVTLGFPSCKALYLKEFYVLGVVLSRAFVDGFTMEVPLLPQVWSLLRACDQPGIVSALNNILKFLEPAMMSSYDYLLKATKEEIDAMELYDEKDQQVRIDTIQTYISQRIAQHFEVGRQNLHAMAVGLLSSIDLSSFAILSDEELTALLCGEDLGKEKGRLFSESEFRAVVMEAHGYSVGAKEVEMFISIVGAEFDATQQGLFLEFLTGSARLPLNGIVGLERKITVVKKPFESKDEQTLPSCNTCFLYFKLPPYTTREVMRKRLLYAITEGRKNFSLS
ncbi:unnamed protein product [Phytomonas sp. Hart1]|nr:unnamed protein product [Phytomonas sp. Hart1]|eukprot:CCW67172.1 unnamed protein product [Phytomonas sp. isolate Hart1]